MNRTIALGLLLLLAMVGWLIVRIQGRDAEARRARDEARAAAEPDEPSVAFFVRALDADTNEPLGDAVVQRVRTPDGDGATGPAAPSDGAGVARLDIPASAMAAIGEAGRDGSGGPRLVRVAAPGYAARVLALAPGHDTAARARAVSLRRAASLVVRVLIWPDVPVPGAVVRLEPESGERSDAHVGEGRAGYHAETGPDGRARLDGLAANAPISVAVTPPGGRVQVQPSGVVLGPGQMREIEVVLTSGSAVDGVLLDESDRPIAGAEIWVTRETLAGRPTDGARAYFYADDERKVAARATTWENGRFHFDDVAPGRWWLGPGAPRRDAPPSPHTALASAIEIRVDDGPLDVPLRAWRETFIAGRVEAPDDLRGPVRIEARRDDVRGVVAIDLATGAREFRAGPLVPGPYRLTAAARGFVPTAPVVAETGRTDVVVGLAVGGILRGRIVDAATGAVSEAAVCVSAPAPADHVSLGGVTGEFERTGLPAGTYAIAAATADGRIGVRTGLVLAAGATIDEIVVPVGPGGRLRLVYQGPEPYADVVVRAAGAIVAAEAIQTGTAVLQTAPLGSVDVELTVRGRSVRRQTVAVAVDTIAEVVFRVE